MKPSFLKHLRYRLEAAFMYALLAIFGLMPLDMASSFGGRIGRTIGPRLAASRKALNNLRTALPGHDQDWYAAKIRGMWDNLGRLIAEYPHIARIGRDRVEIVHGDRAIALVEAHQPAIFFTGHFANWEVLVAGTVARTGLQMDIVYREPNNPYVARLLHKLRSPDGSIVAIRKSRTSVRAMIEALKAGRYLGIPIDQKYNEGLAIPFLGRPAMTSPAFVNLAQKFDCPLIPGQIERLGGARFRITVHEPVKTRDDTGNPRAVGDVIADAHHYLEDWISQHPDQWLWLHRRWAN